MIEFSALFKTSVEGSFDEFSAIFSRSMKILLGNVSRFEELDARQLEGICREVADAESISVLERTEGDKTCDLLLLPLKAGHGKVRYIMAEGSLRHVDVDQLHLLKWLYETRVDTDEHMGTFRDNAVYDCESGLLSRQVIPSLFELEKTRAEDFGAGLGFLILRLRQESLPESLDIIRKSMRRTDYLFRMDNGEVLLLLVECSAHGSEAMMQRMKKILGSRLLSAGYSVYPEQGEKAGELIAEAQGALV